jgi:hypothetical protein
MIFRDKLMAKGIALFFQLIEHQPEMLYLSLLAILALRVMLLRRSIFQNKKRSALKWTRP